MIGTLTDANPIDKAAECLATGSDSRCRDFAGIEPVPHVRSFIDFCGKPVYSPRHRQIAYSEEQLKYEDKCNSGIRTGVGTDGQQDCHYHEAGGEPGRRDHEGHSATKPVHTVQRNNGSHQVGEGGAATHDE